MGSPAFGTMPGNNAPPPIPSMFNTSGNQNAVGFGGSNFPNYPVFGSPNTGIPSPSSNLPLFGSGTNSGINSLFNDPLADYYNFPGFWNQVGKAYGKNTSQALQAELGMLFNPSTAEAFINAMQPSINKGEASVLSAFGAEGSRFGSAASLGLGDYLSQANLNEQQTLASMYMQAQQDQLQLIEGMMPTLHAEQANKGGFWADLGHGLLDITSFGLISNFGKSGGNPSAFMGGMGTSALTSSLFGGLGGTSSVGAGDLSGMTLPANMPSNNDWISSFLQNNLSASAGADLGGSYNNNVPPFLMPGMGG